MVPPKSDVVVEDDTQVSALRHSKHDAEGNRVDEGIWFARIASNQHEGVVVSSDWAFDNFNPKHIHRVMLQSGKNRQFMDVPQGAVTKNADDPCNVSNPNCPKMFFQQGKNDFCLSRSVASAVQHWIAVLCGQSTDETSVSVSERTAELSSPGHDCGKFLKRLDCISEEIEHQVELLHVHDGMNSFLPFSGPF